MKLDTITKQLFYVTVRIEAKNTAGNTWSGTGFMYNAGIGAGKIIPFLVSNKHVVCNDATELTLHFIEKKDDKPRPGRDITVILNEPSKIVIEHPDSDIDIAILPLAPILRDLEQQGKEVMIKLLDKGQVASQFQFNGLDAFQELMFVGYPTGLYDQLNLTPILRRASTATPLQYDYNKKPMFVIDASVYGGSSGSPVLIVNNGRSYIEGGSLHIGSTRVFLIGVLAAVHLSKEKGQLMPISHPQVIVDVPNGLGLVYKWQVVEQLIDEFCHAKNIDR